MKRNLIRNGALGIAAGLLSLGLAMSAPLAATAADIGTTTVAGNGDNLITLDFQNTVSTTETDTVDVYIITTWADVTSTSARLTNVAISIDNTYPYAFSADVGYRGTSGVSGDLGQQTVAAGTAFNQATDITFPVYGGNIYGQVFAEFKGTLKAGPATVTAEYHTS